MSTKYIRLPEELTVLDVHQSSVLTLKDVGQAATYLLMCKGDEKLTLHIEQGADITLIEASDQTPSFSYEIHVEKGASLRHIRIDLTDKNTQYTLHQEGNSKYQLSLISLSGDQDNVFDMHSDGHNTDTRMCGFALCKDHSKIKNTIRLYHHSAECHSYQAFKYVADDYSHATFDGKIIVDTDAQKIEAYQKNNNILLSRNAVIDSDPQLEIYADDVRCSHGSTIGQLDADALFYMQSRGINRKTAMGMLVRSFAEEALSLIDEEWLKTQIEDTISDILK